MKQKTQTVVRGSSTTSLLLVAFIVLKLTHVIDWSWWWVLSPLWIPLALIVALLLFSGVCIFIAKLIE